MPALTAVIPTRNEERNIGRCLQSLQGVVDEIVVVDSGSTDNTAVICEKFGVSRRTAERMRDMIKIRFPQTKETMDDNGFKRWYIPQGTLRDFIQFSAEEVALLETLKTLLEKNNMADKTETLERLTDKIKANVKPDVMRRLEPDVEVLMEAEGFICLCASGFFRDGV